MITTQYRTITLSMIVACMLTLLPVLPLKAQPCPTQWRFTNSINCMLVVSCNGNFVATVAAGTWGQPTTVMIQIPCGCNIPSVSTAGGQTIFNGASGTPYLCCSGTDCATPDVCAKVTILSGLKWFRLEPPPIPLNPCP